MPRKSKRRTRRKRGGQYNPLSDTECNKVAKAICGDVKKFKTEIDVGDENAMYATRIRQQQVACKPAFDEQGEPIMIKSRYGKDRDGNQRMEQQYVDEKNRKCLGDSYLASVPSRNIEDCKLDKHGYGSSQIFKDCHWEKKNNPKSFSSGKFLTDKLNRKQYRTDLSLVGLGGGRRRRRRRKSRKKRRKSKRKKSRRKKKSRRRRRRR